VEPFRDGRLLDLPVNILLGWKLMASTLAFYDMATITTVEKFYSTVPRGLYYKSFYGRNLRIS